LDKVQATARDERELRDVVMASARIALERSDSAELIASCVKMDWMIITSATKRARIMV
jgi:hypothetical protein